MSVGFTIVQKKTKWDSFKPHRAKLEHSGHKGSSDAHYLLGFTWMSITVPPF